jgi:hypothetical protein
MEVCYIISRLEPNIEYYKGDGAFLFKKRWSPKLSKAKRYKRMCDVKNAITNMKQTRAYLNEYSWLNIPKNLKIETYELIWKESITV